MENNTGWVEVLEVTYEKVKFRIDKNISSVSREDKIILKYDTVLQEVPVIQQAVPTAPMIFKVQCLESGAVYLPLWGNIDCFIDWGDGTIEEYHQTEGRNSYINHKYNPNQAKIYKVSVFGKVAALHSHTFWPERNIPLSSIIEVVDWGELGLISLEAAFYEQPLKKVAKPRAKSFENVTSVYYAFYSCSLQELPAGFMNCPLIRGCGNVFSRCPLHTLPLDLFTNCPQVLSFGCCFQDCKSLKTIPENLFAKCPYAYDFTSTFEGCSALESIPEDLFSHSFFPTDVSFCFQDCQSLKTIPENLFNFICYNLDQPDPIDDPLDYFSIMYFAGCTSLTSIPVNLFDNNREVEKFRCTFSYCENLTGESPYTVIDGVKYHLYERENNPEQFIKPIYYISCFKDCVNLSDWNQIPNYWKTYL